MFYVEKKDELRWVPLARALALSRSLLLSLALSCSLSLSLNFKDPFFRSKYTPVLLIWPATHAEPKTLQALKKVLIQREVIIRDMAQVLS